MPTRLEVSWRRPRRSRVPERDGSTLIELLMALVIGGVLVGVAFQAMQAHGRYARVQIERAAVQQGSRAAADLMSVDLRVADPRAITEARPGSVAFRVPRAWGVVCRHTDTALSVLFPTAAVPALASRDEWIAVPPVASRLEWQFLPVTDRTPVAAERALAVDACGALGADITPAAGTASQARLYRAREWSGQGGHLGVDADEMGLVPGTPVYVFDVVRYDAAPTSSAPGLWLRRNSGPAMQMQPLVGPLAAPEGFGFRYYDESGAELLPPLSPMLMRGIRSIELRVALRGRSEANGRPVVDSTRTRVVLRNPY